MTKTVYLSGLKYINCELLRVSNKRELGCILVLLCFCEANNIIHVLYTLNNVHVFYLHCTVLMYTTYTVQYSCNIHFTMII